MSTDVRDALRKSRIFSDLDDAELDRIIANGSIEDWPDGGLVFEQGSSGPKMMVLLEGRVEILKHDEQGIPRTIADLGPGEVLGEMSLLLGLPRTATVRALTTLRMFSIDQRAFQALVDARDPALLHIGIAMARTLAGRLQQLNDRVVDLLLSQDQDDSARDVSDATDEIFIRWR